MINVQYGILKELHINNKFGVRAMIANVVIRQNGQEPIDDAAWGAVLMAQDKSFDGI